MKTLPHSVEAEQFVLGGLLLNNAAYADVAERIGEEDFYRGDHRAVWRALCAIASKRQPMDLLTLTEQLTASGEMDEAGGKSYVYSLGMDIPSASNILTYAQVVRERAMLREIIQIGYRAAELGYDRGELTMEDVLAEIEKGVFAIRQRGDRERSGPVDMAQLVELAERGVELRSKTGGGITGLRSGIADLDDRTTGLHPGDLVIIAGRPSMGKTSLAQNIAEHCAIDQGKWALVFSMEMPGEQLALRSIASRNRIPLQDLRRGSLDQAGWDRMSRGGGVLRAAKLLIDETPALSPNEIRARARRAAMRNPLGLIVVDYLQLMQVRGTKENRTNEISEISRSMKALAKEMGVPVIALSQLNRGVEQRDNKRPRMSDLRDSGGIEQDADLILFVYRDEVYSADSPDAGTAELIIGKQRNGALGTVRTAFVGEFCRFENLAYDWRPAATEAPKPRQRGFGSSHAAHSVGRDA